MDLTETIEPRSDQINSDDLITGPRIVTITEVSKGNTPEQPVNITTAEFGKGRPYKPSKTMRRVLVSAWGKDSTAYVGRRLMIYRDPTIKFGGDTVGGIGISYMSDIDGRLTLALTATRGKKKTHVIEPLPAGRDWLHEIESATTKDELRALWGDAPAEVRPYITERLADIEPQQEVEAES